MRAVRALLYLLLTVVVVGAGMAAWAMRHPAIDPVAPPDPASLDPELVERGQTLAAIGGCASCHSTPGGEEMAGGLAFETPFGTLHSTNITPHPESGIGSWSQEVFLRAMRAGVDRSGSHLYPAFPYDHFTKVTDEDLAAIYAFLMSLPAVEKPATPNALSFPFNIRLLMAGWNLLFLDAGAFEPDASKDETWNRGAYLVEGLGHCAACHSPRNALGARDKARDYDGAVADNWYSPALNAASPAPVPWTEEALVNYLFDGWEETHGIAAGPMREVAENTASLPEEDVVAVAAYVLSLQAERAGDAAEAEAAIAFAEQVAVGGPGPVEEPQSAAAKRGMAVFERRCVNCHRADSEAVPLALATAVAGPSPRNFIHIVLEGATPTENAFFVKPMPGFPMLSDEELADLAAFTRERYSDAPAWPDVEATIEAIRGERD